MESLEGQLLVASPQLQDPNFARSLVLLVQHNNEGAFGLMEAVNAYDPSMPNTFATFCSKRVYGAIIDHLRQMDPTPRLMREREPDRAHAHRARELQARPRQRVIGLRVLRHQDVEDCPPGKEFGYQSNRMPHELLPCKG